LFVDGRQSTATRFNSPNFTAFPSSSTSSAVAVSTCAVVPSFDYSVARLGTCRSLRNFSDSTHAVWWTEFPSGIQGRNSGRGSGQRSRLEADGLL